MKSGRRYEVRGLLGEGAFGAVYLARAVGGGIQRDVAIKVLHRERGTNPALVGRLRDEARMLALIRHRAIVRVDDLIELDGDWSIVMEYVQGCDVAALLRGGAVAPAVALAIAEEVANALHAAWTQPGPDGSPLKLIHRDIKPANVRVTAQGEVKLLDFGVARAEFAEREAGTTQSGFGTIAYMAPERFEGKDSHQGDIYALGVFLFELLTGTKPGKTAADRERQPPGVQRAEQWAYIAGLSPDLHGLVAAMLAYEPAHRPTARDCARALSDLRNDLRGERLEDWAARVVPTVLAAGGVAPRDDMRTGTILTERSAQTKRTAPERPVTRVLPWLAGGVVTLVGFVVVLVLSGLGAWWVLREPGGASGGAASAAGAVVQAPERETAGAARPGEVGATPTTGASAGTAPVKGSASGTAAPAKAPATGASTRSTASRAPAPRSAAPAPAESTPPKPAARAETVEAAESGRLRIAGDPVKATFKGVHGAVSPGDVAAGAYTAEVIFAGESTPVTIRNVVVNPGRVTWLTCKADFRNCVATQE